MGRRLVEAAAHVLAGSGPSALSARKVAAAAGTSTMSVYTCFGSMEVLVRAVVEEGFAMLERRLVEVEPTDDPVRDVAAQTAAYLAHAREYAELYAVMFGTAPLGQFRLPPPTEEQRGRTQTLDRIAANLGRAVEEGRLRRAAAGDLSFQWWSSVHGYALLETTGFIHADPGRSRVLEPVLVAFFVGRGDDLARAEASVGKGLQAG
jgi:AcrR family transcriptional regulator